MTCLKINKKKGKTNMYDQNQTYPQDDFAPADENQFGSSELSNYPQPSFSEAEDNTPSVPSAQEETAPRAGEENGDLKDQNKLVLLKSVLQEIRAGIDKAIRIIEEDSSLALSSADKPLLSYSEKMGEMVGVIAPAMKQEESEEEGAVIEGVFDGQNMIGPEGKQYSVPANYASKSKLVEGDILKLRIAPNGAFIFKQIGPIGRKRTVGILALDEETNNYYVLAEGRKYRVLTASVTYFKGHPGDEATIVIPEEGQSGWAAVENIMKR